MTLQQLQRIEQSFRHDVAGDTADHTLCGIEASPETNDIDIACDCGHPECQLPVTCPACIAVKKGWEC